MTNQVITLIRRNQGNFLVGSRFLSTASVWRQSAEASSLAVDLSHNINDDVNAYVDTVKRAQEKFRAHPDSYFNIDLKEVEVVKENSYPTLQYRGETSRLSHLSPFLPIQFSRLGPYGNTGQNKYKSEEVIEPAESMMTLGFGNQLDEQYLAKFPELADMFKADYDEYMTWVGQIRSKYVTHLSENINEYEQLKKYTSYDMITADVLEKMIDRATSVNVRKSAQNEEVKYTVCERNTYIKAQSGVNEENMKFKSDLDLQVFRETKKTRMNLKVFDHQNRLQPWTYNAWRNDIGSFRNAFRLTLAETGHGSKLLLQSACIIPKLRENTESLSSSPYGSF